MVYTCGILSNISKLPSNVCGPAIKSQIDFKFNFDIDAVLSLFCPQWPTEAKNWPLRPRKYGWPTMGTISEVVKNGCHVVYVVFAETINNIGYYHFQSQK